MRLAVMHKACGEQVGWVDGDADDEGGFTIDEFFTMDGVGLEPGTRFRCPGCSKWIREQRDLRMVEYGQ